jgi:hypothetical protein
VLHRHRAQVRHDAAVLEAQARRLARRALGLVLDRHRPEGAAHAEMDVDDVGRGRRAVGRPEEVEQVLSVHLDARERLVVDCGRAVGEAAVGRRGGERAAEQQAAVRVRDAVAPFF